MLKILPITLIPLFFFSFYFNVIFLTDSNLPEIENLGVESKSEKNTITEEKKNISTILDENKNELNENIDMKSNNLPERLEKTNDGNFVKNINKKETTKRTRVQFGAFKSEKNVVNLESKLAKIFKKEFGDDFGSFLILKDEKHLKLILNANSVLDAKNICNFSKKNNINCLIIN